MVTWVFLLSPRTAPRVRVPLRSPPPQLSAVCRASAARLAAGREPARPDLGRPGLREQGPNSARPPGTRRQAQGANVPARRCRGSSSSRPQPLRLLAPPPGVTGAALWAKGQGPRRRLPSQVIRGRPLARPPPGVDVQGCAHWDARDQPRGRSPPFLADPHIVKARCRPQARGGLSVTVGQGPAPNPGPRPPAPFVTIRQGVGASAPQPGGEVRALTASSAATSPQGLRSLPGQYEHCPLAPCPLSA